ncbi:uncharacterized protein [Drosophila takahashii]|uniref:uncharacterized protein n=1 Tax=Drosophila takahashii TaxID=29030 RepID=UPI001CF82FE6|nr:uncharacterized protein LOC123002799 [Drosophila takahashii]
MTLSNTISSVKVGSGQSETFSTKCGLRQGHSLSCMLFNILMESIISKAGMHWTGTILTNRCVQLLGYADDIDVIGRTKHDVTGPFGAIGKKSAKVGLAVNREKTKFMVCSSRESRRLDVAALGVFERKILRKIVGPICVDDVYRIRYNHELYELYGDVDVASRVKSQRLCWLGHIARMDEDAPARKVFDAVIVGTRRR